MPRGSSPKRERQYEHIKESVLRRGEKESRAEEIAARTVNKERARAGESKTASRTSLQDISSSRRGGLRSHTGAGGRTKEQLYAEAKRRNIKGRSTMSKAQLEKALGSANAVPGDLQIKRLSGRRARPRPTTRARRRCRPRGPSALAGPR
ncbi:hypothetical protein AB0O34_00025 [Sphaerisporangium sp. NPDC088356]|uniref:hypothetical protein n=1 Tax=Sphaerisporangium sp. NPDC088356 TaxID=3154871 RepID=UPI00343203F3